TWSVPSPDPVLTVTTQSAPDPETLWIDAPVTPDESRAKSLPAASSPVTGSLKWTRKSIVAAFVAATGGAIDTTVGGVWSITNGVPSNSPNRAFPAGSWIAPVFVRSIARFPSPIPVPTVTVHWVVGAVPTGVTLRIDACGMVGASIVKFENPLVSSPVTG